MVPGFSSTRTVGRIMSVSLCYFTVVLAVTFSYFFTNSAVFFDSFLIANSPTNTQIIDSKIKHTLNSEIAISQGQTAKALALTSLFTFNKTSAF